jgi:hypothetical protein
MTDAKSDNWYPDGENAARITEDLLPATVTPEAAGAAAEEIFDAGGREAFLFPIFRSKVWEIGKCATQEKTVKIPFFLFQVLSQIELRQDTPCDVVDGAAVAVDDAVEKKVLEFSRLV